MALCVVGAVAARAESSWLFNAWQTTDGLPNNDVSAVAQAADGAMLFGTQRGLARFDGWRVRAVDTGLAARQSRWINGVLPARDGTLWLVVGNQLAALRPGRKAETWPLPDFTAGQRPTAVLEGAPGELWLSFEDHPFVHISTGRADQPPAVETVAISGNTMLARDRTGAIWAAGPAELSRWQDGRFQRIAALPPEKFRLCAARDSSLWIGSDTQLYRSSESGEVREVARLPAGRPGRHISALLEDRAGRVWFGTVGDGLYLWNGGTFQKIPLSNRDVWSLCEDREGNPWAGTGGGGACRVRPRVLAPLDEPGIPADQTARSLCADARGDIWVALQTNQMISTRSPTVARPHFARRFSARAKARRVSRRTAASLRM